MKKNIIVFSVILLFIISCSETSKYPENKIRVASADNVTTLNPMYAYNITEGNISELLYLPLIKQEWNNGKKNLEPVGYLAEKWKWENDHKLSVTLRNGITWSDSVPVTVKDFVYSLVTYSDTASHSKFYGYFDNFITDNTGKISVEKSFEIISDTELYINFNPESQPTLVDVDFPVIPEHYFGQIPVNELETSDKNVKPVSNGPFLLKEFNRNTSVILTPRKDHFLYANGTAPEIEFQEITDYQTRLLMLNQGETDIIFDVVPDDVESIQNTGLAKIYEVAGRDYDFIGWNNIIFDESSERYVPHPLFGNKEVRKALSMAINKKQIIDDYLKGYGIPANGPVTPVVFDNYNTDLDIYNPDSAKSILAAQGWYDSDTDGYLDKNGTRFEFNLTVVADSKRKKFAAQRTVADLDKIGIKANLKQVDYNKYVDDLFARKIDAWSGGWYIPLPVEFATFWHSGPDAYPMNFPGYSSEKADSLFAELKKYPVYAPPKELLEEIQETVFNDHPVTFLYWVNQIAGINERVKNIDVNPLGVIHTCWNWRVE